MLQSLHEVIKGWIAKVLFILIAITFAFFGTQSYYRASGNTGARAEVNGQVITEQQVRDTYRRLSQQVAAEGGPDYVVTPAIEEHLKEESLKQLIKQIVLESTAEKLGFNVTLSQAEQMLLQIPAFQEDGKFSKAKFEQVIHSANFTPSTYIHQLQRGILANQVQAGFVGSEFSLPGDITRAYNLVHQARDFRYVLIKSDGFAQKDQPSQAEQDQYYKEHAQQFTMPAKVKLEYLMLSVPELMSQQKLSNDDIKNYYQANSANYQTPARWEVAHILIDNSAKELATQIAERANKGEDFSKLAREFSIDKLSAQKGGLLPSLTAENLPKTLASSVVTLNTKDQIIGPIETPYGFEILKCIQYSAPQLIPFDNVKNSIRESMLRDQVQQQFASLSDEMANSSYQNPDSLAQASKTVKTPIKTTDWVASDGTTTDKFAQNKKILQAAFSEDVLTNRNNSEVIQISDEAVAVIRIKEYQPATVKPFEQVKAEVIQSLQKSRQEKATETVAEKILEDLNAKQSQEALLKSNHLSWVDVKAAERSNTKIPAPIVKSAFSMSPPSKTTLAVQSLRLENGDYAVVQLLGIDETPTKKMNNEERNLIRTRIENNRGMMAYQLLEKSIQDQAKIKIH